MYMCVCMCMHVGYMCMYVVCVCVHRKRKEGKIMRKQNTIIIIIDDITLTITPLLSLVVAYFPSWRTTLTT